ncbi:MAG: metallophosphoesterase [Chitinophagaceae bacterium]|nr:metallophosphoesterase [Chitinophagaceae bacterium]
MLLKLFISGLFALMVTPARYISPQDAGASARPEIAFASDTQAPLWMERLMLKAHNNRTATRLIFDDIVMRQPRALFLLGDVVSWGSSGLAWRRVNRYLDSCRKHGIALYATLGNHELMGIRGMRTKAQKIFQHQFPEFRKTGFAQVVDSIGVILLNSNFGDMSKQEDSAQVKWFTKTLAEMDADPSIQYIITGCHHSPFTNSRIVGPNRAVQEKFVAPFLQTRKTVLFLSGHAHAFEHFNRNKKEFMVIGGGGGVHQPLHTGERELVDLASSYKPMFHYLAVRKNAGNLQVVSYKLDENFKTFSPGMMLTIDQPALVEKN